MKTNNSLKKQLEKEQDCLNFIKLWFKGTWSVTGISWIISILLLTKLNIDLLLIPSILLTGGITLSSIYMLIQGKKIKNNIKKLTHKIYIEETSLMIDQLNKQNIKNNTTKHDYNHSNNYNYNYNPNNSYNHNQLNNHANKDYKTKRRILKHNKEHKDK